MPPSFSLMNWTAACAPSPTSGNVPAGSPSRFGSPMTNGSRLSSAASGDDSAASRAAAHSSAPSPSSPTGGPPPPPAVSSGDSVDSVSASVASVSASVASVSASVASVPASVPSASPRSPRSRSPRCPRRPCRRRRRRHTKRRSVRRNRQHSASRSGDVASSSNPLVTPAHGGHPLPPWDGDAKCRRVRRTKWNAVKSSTQESRVRPTAPRRGGRRPRGDRSIDGGSGFHPRCDRSGSAHQGSRQARD